MEKEFNQEEICKSHKEAGVTCEFCKEEFNLKEKIVGIFRDRKNWHSNLIRDKVLEVNKEFIKLVKDFLYNLDGDMDEEWDKIDEGINKLSGGL